MLPFIFIKMSHVEIKGEIKYTMCNYVLILMNYYFSQRTQVISGHQFVTVALPSSYCSLYDQTLAPDMPISSLQSVFTYNPTTLWSKSLWIYRKYMFVNPSLGCSFHCDWSAMPALDSYCQPAHTWIWHCVKKHHLPFKLSNLNAIF